MKKIDKTTLFLLLTFFLTYSVVGLFWLLGGERQSLVGTIVFAGCMLVPAISVFIVEKLVHKQHIKTNLLISFKLNPWFVFAWLIAPCLAFATFGISLLFPDVTFSPDMAGILDKFKDALPPEEFEEAKQSLDELPIHPIWLSLIQGLIAGVSINALAAFGEELGWRGFLLKQYKHMSFIKAAVLIGTIWGLWHAPMILLGHNYPDHPQIGVIMMTVWCILLSPLFLYTTIKSKSVIAASILHGTLNATAGLAVMLIDGGNDLTEGVTGLSGFLALGIVLAGLFVYDKTISGDNIMTSIVERKIG